MNYKTEQENFWKGNFGNEYTDRNRGKKCVASNLFFFSKVLTRTQNINNILELGSNIGLNLTALKQLLPDSHLSAVEINKKAASELKKNLPDVDLNLTSILNFSPETKWDLVFTKDVLIHINPDELCKVYDLIYTCSERYILLAEYYNPQPTEVNYRGHKGKLFKRDFAGDMLDKYNDLILFDYGFIYHRDPNFPQDDMSWFLMEKKTEH